MSNLFNQWKNGLAKSSKAAFGQIATLLGATEITAETWDDLEALLVQADLGMETTDAILDNLEKRVDSEGLIKASDLKSALRQELRKLLSEPPQIDFSQQPTVILVVGVNGSGKTTSIAKLGKRFSEQGKSVILGAADTYRAAAVDQLEIWAERLKLPIISGQQGGDAGAVVYDTDQSRRSTPYRYRPDRYCRSFTYPLQPDGRVEESPSRGW